MATQLLLLALLVFSSTVSTQTTESAETSEDERDEQMLKVVTDMVQRLENKIDSLEDAVQTSMRKHNDDSERMEQMLIATQAIVIAGQDVRNQTTLTVKNLEAIESQLVELGCGHIEDQTERLACRVKNLVNMRTQTLSGSLSALIESNDVGLTSSLPALKVVMENATEAVKDQIKVTIAQITGVCGKVAVSGYYYSGVYELNGNWCVADGHGGARPVYQHRTTGLLLYYRNDIKEWVITTIPCANFSGCGARGDVKSPELSTSWDYAGMRAYCNDD